MSSKANKKYKRDLIPGHCEYPGCEYNFFVARHRIKPGKVGGKYIAGNVIGLCPNHHVEADAGKIGKFELFKIVQERIKRTLKSRETNGYFEWDGVKSVPTDRLAYIAYTPNGLHRDRRTL